MPEVLIEPGFLCLRVTTEHAAHPAFARFGDLWREEGRLAGDELRFDRDAWLRAGRPSLPESDDPEETEYWLGEWAAQHDALVDLFNVDLPPVELELVGAFGMPGARLACRIDEVEVHVRGDGPHQVRAPFVEWLLAQVREFATTTRAGQLHIVAALRHAVDALLPRLMLRPSIRFYGILQEIEPIVPRRFSLEWEAVSGANDVLSLKTKYEDADGQVHALSYRHFDPAGIVATDFRRPVLLPPDVTRVIEQTKRRDRVRRSSVGDELHDPSLLFPEGTGDEWFDLSRYASRVLGFELVKPEKPAVVESSGVDWFGPREHDAPPFALVSAVDQSGLVRQLALADEEQVRALLDDVERALEQGDSELPVGSTGIVVRPSLALRETLARALSDDPKDAGIRHSSSGVWAAKVKALERSETDADGIKVDESRVPWDRLEQLLRPGIALKPHQRRGLAWLWSHLLDRSSGVLLADDMGLGKTLQAAAFLALVRDSNPESRHLIVCPTVLLDVWLEETARFFREDTFDIYKLHEQRLASLRLPNGALSLERLVDQRIILTNYETLGRYQRSLLQLDFHTVVFDEAQYIKNPDSLRARAARALKREFAVALTGTPVENKLTDLWAIFDALQARAPRLFGTKEAFERDFTSRGREGVHELRKTMRYPSAGSNLLRREKSEALRDLPEKKIHVARAAMTDAQAEAERKIVRMTAKRGALAILAELRKLYQHPLLLTDGLVRLPVNSAISQSPKLQLCVELLDQIADRGEKALVFSVSRAMQELLAEVFMRRYRLPRVHLINGDPRTRGSALARIDDFSRSPGFDVMVLSPLAAGAGLTITAANHVIHYERWWNPAKEDQASDRAYRIGQTRPVTIYYPLLHRPGQPDAGFDIGLHLLVAAKRKLARDFLAPTDDLEVSDSELQELISEHSS